MIKKLWYWFINRCDCGGRFSETYNGNNGTITGATWSSDTPSKARTAV